MVGYPLKRTAAERSWGIMHTLWEVMSGMNFHLYGFQKVKFNRDRLDERCFRMLA